MLSLSKCSRSELQSDLAQTARVSGEAPIHHTTGNKPWVAIHHPRSTNFISSEAEKSYEGKVAVIRFLRALRLVEMTAKDVCSLFEFARIRLKNNPPSYSWSQPSLPCHHPSPLDTLGLQLPPFFP